MMLFQHPLCLPPFPLLQKKKGNESETVGGNLNSYYVGVWVQRTVPGAKKYAIFAFQSGCIKPQETENWYNPDTQITFKLTVNPISLSIYIQKPKWFSSALARDTVWLGKSAPTQQNNVQAYFFQSKSLWKLHVLHSLFQATERQYFTFFHKELYQCTSKLQSWFRVTQNPPCFNSRLQRNDQEVFLRLQTESALQGFVSPLQTPGPTSAPLQVSPVTPGQVFLLFPFAYLGVSSCYSAVVPLLYSTQKFKTSY